MSKIHIINHLNFRASQIVMNGNIFLKISHLKIGFSQTRMKNDAIDCL